MHKDIQAAVDAAQRRGVDVTVKTKIKAKADKRGKRLIKRGKR